MNRDNKPQTCLQSKHTIQTLPLVLPVNIYMYTCQTLFCRRVFWSLTPPHSLQLSAMSRTVKKAVEAARQRKETEINVSDEGISNIEDVPELCKYSVKACFN